MLEGLKFRKINRRGKYLLFENDYGHMIIHLGMSGSLRIVKADEPPGKHDHVDFVSPRGIFSGLKTHEDSVVFYGKIKVKLCTLFS